MSLCTLCLAGPIVKQVDGYTIGVCRQCWQQAEHGWPRQFEQSLFQALSRQSLLIPDRNDAGHLPRCYAPPADFNL